MRARLLSTLLFLTGCAAVAAPTAPVEVTRVVEVEVTRIVEVVVTATPTAAPVLLPTPTPAPQLIPNGWQTYELMSGTAVVPFPPNWSIENELPMAVTLTNNGDIAQVVYAADTGRPTREDGPMEDMLRFIKMGYADTANLDTVRFIAEGTLPEVGRENVFFIVERTDYVYKDTRAEIQILVKEGERYALVQAADVSTAVLPPDIQAVAIQIAASIHFQ
jgi:hypothetical protein